MKMFFAVFLIGFGVASASRAEEPLNCLQWNLQTNPNFVTENETQQTVDSLIRAGTEFGFVIDESFPGNTPNDIYFIYDRAKIVDNPSLTKDYEDFIVNSDWHLGSMRGYSFRCSFAAGGPLPRISGSN